jgi:DNA-directed RNA polymerase beta subunit
MLVALSQELDETGVPEEFSWDLFPLVKIDQTSHLDRQGLPKLGTNILPGMIVIGKIARTHEYNRRTPPSSLEIHGMSFEELKEKYGMMWVDRSYYADQATCGVVKRAEFERLPNDLLRAVVEIEPSVLC